MKIWYDTEFIEQGPSLPIELVSIGMVRDDGATLYLVNADVSLSKLVRDPWLQMNVVPHLPIKLTNTHSDMLNGIVEWDTEHPDVQSVVSSDTIADMVRQFCLQDLAEGDKPELWAYYGAYDHVVLCQLYGRMSELPSGMPMYTLDIVQEWARLGWPAILPKSNEDERRALGDALWAQSASYELEHWRGWVASYGAHVNPDERVEAYKLWKETGI